MQSIAMFPRTPLGGLLEIATSATPLNTVTNGDRSSTLGWEIQVPDDADHPVYVGGANVTDTGATQGREVVPGDSYLIQSASLAGWYAAASTAAVNVRITGYEGGP